MKTLVLVILLLLATASMVFAFPTYTSNAYPIGAGTYGATDIPIVFADETGNQLFDGDYGRTGWLAYGPRTEEEYLAQYADQNGYAIPYVAWYHATAVITFDMKNPYWFSQLGIHGYGSYTPTAVTVQFSNDNVVFFNPFNLYFSGEVIPSTLIWETGSFSEIESRYIQIAIDVSDRIWIDEMSINGMDGANFVPEPSSLMALVGGLSTLGFLKRIYPLYSKRRR